MGLVFIVSLMLFSLFESRKREDEDAERERRKLKRIEQIRCERTKSNTVRIDHITRKREEEEEILIEEEEDDEEEKRERISIDLRMSLVSPLTGIHQRHYSELSMLSVEETKKRRRRREQHQMRE